MLMLVSACWVQSPPLLPERGAGSAVLRASDAAVGKSRSPSRSYLTLTRRLLMPLSYLELTLGLSLGCAWPVQTQAPRQALQLCLGGLAGAKAHPTRRCGAGAQACCLQGCHLLRSCRRSYSGASAIAAAAHYPVFYGMHDKSQERKDALPLLQPTTRSDCLIRRLTVRETWWQRASLRRWQRFSRCQSERDGV